MTLDDLEHQNSGFFIDFLTIFRLQHTFQEQFAPKSLEDNLHTQFSGYMDFSGPSLSPLCLSRPAHEGFN